MSHWLILALSLVAAILCYTLMQRKYAWHLQHAAVVELSKLFPHARVSVERCLRDEAGTMSLVGVRLKSKDPQDRGREVVYIERAKLSGQLDVQDWVQARIGVHQIDLYGIRLSIWPRASGQWSWQAVVPRPNRDRLPPVVVVHDAVVHVARSAEESESVITLHDIRGESRPVQTRPTSELQQPGPAEDGVAGSQVAEAVEASLVSAPLARMPAGVPSPFARPEQLMSELVTWRSMQPQRFEETTLHWSWTGRCGGLLESISAEGEIELGTGRWWAAGTVNRCEFSPVLLQRLPPAVADSLDQLRGLRGTVSGDFRLASRDGADLQSSFRGAIHEAAFQDPRLPYRLDGMACEFAWIDGRVQLRNLRASSGPARVEANADLAGLAAGSPVTILADVSQLELDSRLYSSLPESLRKMWDRLELSGMVSGHIELRFDGEQWKPVVNVQCNSVKIRPWLFPYPVTDIEGAVVYRRDHLMAHGLVGRAGGQVVSGSVSLHKDGTQWVGTMTCQTEGPVTVDEQLVAALTPTGQPTSPAEQFLRALNPAGRLRVNRAEFRRGSASDQWHKELDLSVYDGKIRYEGFRYPIYDIRGRVVAQDNHWWLDRFEGSNDTARVLCSGDWHSEPTGLPPLNLRFQAYAVPMEEELKRALPSEAQFVWDELQPSGSVDEVRIELVRETPLADVMASVAVREDRSTNDATGRSLRIRPRSFPFWLTDVDCEISYVPGMVTIHHAEGINGATRMAVTGICQPTADGRWKADVEWLPQTRLFVNTELLKALPSSIRETLVKADFRGPVSLLGTSQVVFADSRTENLETAWDCKMAIEDGQLGDGSTIGSLRGTVWMRGVSAGDTLRASGFVAMDALTFLRIPVTRLNGPFAILGSNLYFGTSVAEVLPPVDKKLATALTAKALSGDVAFSGHARLDSGKLYLEGNLQEARLSLLLKDLGVEHSDAEALCDAELHFAGIPWNPQTYNGNGRLHLSQARVYQLPFMIRLLRAASVRPDNNSAFDSADIHFEIDGDRIPLYVACEGDLLRLRGDGETNLRREIDLDLYSYVGRRLPAANVLNPIIAESRYATFMLIEVDGTLENPVMQRRPFPQIEATFNQIFPELAEQRRENPLLPWRK
ncbi:MAG: hypothetical protein D6753_10455 [Planctomycetota bacterium]|nr:MAG: hypothetical protein D6753_10455 [Planctomycetota bacterium]